MKERNSHFLRGTENISLFTDTKSSFLVLELFNPLKFLTSTILTKEFYLCCDNERCFNIIRCSNTAKNGFMPSSQTLHEVSAQWEGEDV